MVVKQGKHKHFIAILKLLRFFLRSSSDQMMSDMSREVIFDLTQQMKS